MSLMLFDEPQAVRLARGESVEGYIIQASNKTLQALHHAPHPSPLQLHQTSTITLPKMNQEKVH